MLDQRVNRTTERTDKLFPLLVPFGFAALGLVLGLFLVTVAGVLQKHSHRYAEMIAFASFFIVPVLIAYGWTAFKQAVQTGKTLFKNLYWYHYLWALLFLSMLTWRKRDISEIRAEPVDTFAAVRLVTVTVVGSILLYRLFTRRTDWLRSWFRGIPGTLMLFVLAALCSCFWSIYWQWTLYKACEYAVDVAMLAAVLAVIQTPDEFKHLFDWTWMWYGILLGMCWLGAALWPDIALTKQMEYGESGIGLIPVQLSGVFPDVSANRVGEYSALLCCVALARLLPVKGWHRVMKSWYSWMFLASFTTMIFAQTRSAILGFGVGVFFIFLFSGRVRLGTVIVVGSVLFIVITGSGGILYDYLRRGQTPAEMATLTGRIQWWEFAWKKFTDAPLTGFGAWAAGRFLIMGAIGNNIGSMHSDWVEVLVGTGFAGIIPLVATLALGWGNLIRYVRDFSLSPLERQLALEAIGVFSVVCTRTIFSTDFTWHCPLSFWIPLGFAEYLRRRYWATETYRAYPAFATSLGSSRG